MRFVLPFFPGIPLSPLTRQLTLRDDREKAPISYSCGSIVHSQCHRAATAELLNKLGDKTGAEDALNTGRSTFPDQRAVWLHLNTPWSGVLQYRGCQQSQTRHGNGSGPGWEMRPEAGLGTVIQQCPSTGQDNSVQGLPSPELRLFGAFGQRGEHPKLLLVRAIRANLRHYLLLNSHRF